MILKIYHEIAQFITDNLPEGEKVWIDLDRGQLRNPESFETLILPAVLISFEDGIQWQSTTQQTQFGDVTFSLKIINRLPQPLFFNSAFNDNLLELLIEDTINIAITKNKHVQRITTKAYPVHTVFITEHHYQTGYDYEPPAQQTKHYRDLNLKTTFHLQK